MTECILNLSNLEMEYREYFVLYASKDQIIYRDKQYLVTKSCDDQITSQISIPTIFSHYEYTTLDRLLVFIIGGKYLFYNDFSKSTIEELSVQRTGKFLSRIYPTEHEDSIITMSNLHGKVHFIIYNILKKKRLFQSSSWEASQINDIVVFKDKIYCLMDNSYIVCCNLNTCETLWTKFETGIINPQLIPSENGIIYCCNGLVRILENKNVQTIHIPLARPSTLERLIDNKLYYTSNSRKNVCCYDLSSKKLIWEITGTNPIIKTIHAYGIDDNKTQNDILITHSSDSLSIVNLTLGRIHSHFRVPGIRDIKLSQNHILIHKQFNYTNILTGI